MFSFLEDKLKNWRTSGEHVAVLEYIWRTSHFLPPVKEVQMNFGILEQGLEHFTFPASNFSCQSHNFPKFFLLSYNFSVFFSLPQKRD